MSTMVPHHAAGLSGKACGLAVGGRRAKSASLLRDGGLSGFERVCRRRGGVSL